MGLNVSVRDKLTREVTDRIAALVLLHPDFPDHDLLPIVKSLPFINLGHLVLLDYRRLAQILWGTAYRISLELLRLKSRRFAARLAGIVAMIAVAWIWDAVAPESDGLGYLFALAAGVCLFIAIKPDLAHVAASERSKVIQRLLNQEDPDIMEDANAVLEPIKWIKCGRGELSKDQVPVLMMVFDTDPFPGYGRVQTQQILVCRPAAPPDPVSPITEENLRSRVEGRLREACGHLGISNASCGNVIVVDGRTIGLESAWLVDDTPRLYLTAEEMPGVCGVDRWASVRVFFAIEVLLPDHCSSITVFVRPFMIGSAAAFNITVCTLGPPSFDWSEIQEVLHRSEVRRDWSLSTFVPDSHIVLGIYNARVSIHQTRSFEGSVPWARSKLEVQTVDEAKFLERESRLLRKESSRWPGGFLWLDNWRERYSMTVTKDYFGGAECRATIQSVVDRVARAVLAEFKDIGFETNDYLDPHGRLTINASKIESLVVGEQIVMESGKPPLKTKEQFSSVPAAPAAQISKG